MHAYKQKFYLQGANTFVMLAHSFYNQTHCVFLHFSEDRWLDYSMTQGRRSEYESGGDGIHVNPERIFGGTNGEPPSEASQLRKGGPGVLPRKISKTYMANGAIYVIPELYL